MKSTLRKIIRYLQNTHRIEKPVKDIVGLLLQGTGVSRYLRIEREGYTIRFCPHSVLARSLWISPQGRMREERFVKTYLQRGDTLVDVGANIGTITLAGAFQVGDTGRVLAIEPHPRTFACLVENGKLNAFTNIEYYNGAVGASEGVAGFSDKGDDDQNKVIDKGGISVEMTTLDALLEERGIASVDLLKIDVEGYEKHVLEGAQQTLKNTRCVYIETLERNLTAFGTNSSEILQILQTSGFRLFHVDHKTEETVAVKEPAALEARTGMMHLVEL